VTLRESPRIQTLSPSTGSGVDGLGRLPGSQRNRGLSLTRWGESLGWIALRRGTHTDCPPTAPRPRRENPHSEKESRIQAWFQGGLRGVGVSVQVSVQIAHTPPTGVLPPPPDSEPGPHSLATTAPCSSRQRSCVMPREPPRPHPNRRNLGPN